MSNPRGNGSSGHAGAFAQGGRRQGRGVGGDAARWAREGLIPQYEHGGWTPGAVGHARFVARMRERGHSLEEIRRATDEGRLAFGYIEELFPPSTNASTRAGRPRARRGSSRR